MSKFKKNNERLTSDLAALLGNGAAVNAQNATNEAFMGMRLFAQKNSSPIIQNGQFAQAKGNLFEYIEVAKFNVDAARKGVKARAYVTDALGDPGAAADIIITQDNILLKEVQAKFSQTSNKGIDTSAITSVREQTGIMNKGVGQYNGMDRLIRKQENYKNGASLLDEAKKVAHNRGSMNDIYADAYKDVEKHLTDELHYDKATSGGTTIEEVRAAYDNPKAYVNAFERKQMISELKCTTANMAAAGAIMSGVTSGISNVYQVCSGKKDIDEALKCIGVDVIKGGARGAATGAVSTGIRYAGLKRGSQVLSNSTVATLMAASIVDTGVSLFAYAKGEKTAAELAGDIAINAGSAATTLFITRSAASVVGHAVSPVVPMAVYTTSNMVFTATREIIQRAELEAREMDRLAAVLKESAKEINRSNSELSKYIDSCSVQQQEMYNKFLASFNYNMETGENYDDAINSIVSFADKVGIELNHVSFEDFSSAMRSRKTFRLE